MSDAKQAGGPSRDDRREDAEAEELLAFFRRQGAALPRTPAEIDRWAESTKGRPLDPGFAKKAVDAVKRGLDESRLRTAREHVRLEPLPALGRLVRQLRETAQLSLGRVAQRLGVQEDELRAVEGGKNPVEISVDLLAGLAEYLGLQFREMSVSIRRAFHEFPNTAAGTPVFTRRDDWGKGKKQSQDRASAMDALLMADAAKRAPKDLAARVEKIEHDLRDALRRRGRTDLLE